MPFGYWGKVLHVDLSTRRVESEHPPARAYREYLGGYGLGLRLLYDRIPPGADPLGPHNVLAFLPGLLTGSGALFGGRFMVAARSPLTGAWADANCGGDFGPALRGAGLDGLLVSGAADSPVYLLIDGERVEIRDAAHLWGLDARATEEALRKATASDARVACIGPAGEKRALLAGIVNDGGRLAARGGLGAVMGAKNLKAVVARGKARPPLADAAGFRAASASYRRLFRRKPSWLSARIPAFLPRLLPWVRRLGGRLSGGPAEMVIDSYRRYGTSAGTSVLVELGDTPVRNWTGLGYRDFPLDLSEGLSDRAVAQRQRRPYACHACPVACGGHVIQPDGGQGHKPEYESLAAFGPLLMNADLDTVMRCTHLCNLAGLDSISVGVAIAFALECAQRGWLPPDLAREMPLAWGDPEAILELTRRIAERTPGLGDWLADGVRRAADHLAPEARAAAMHAGGQELPMHRGLYEPGVAAGYALDPAPGRHTSTNAGNAEVAAFARVFAALGVRPAGRGDDAGEGRTQAVAMPLYRAFDALGLCHFALLMGEPPLLAWLNAATGWGLDDLGLYQIGRRIQVLRHAFNARHGLPERFDLPARERGEPPETAGPLRGRTLDLDAMARAYFDHLGLDPETGRPRPETARELGLEHLVSTP